MSNSLGFSANGVAFGGANTANVTIDASSANDAIALPVGSSAARPVGRDGYIRYNSDLHNVELYKSGSWGPVANLSNVNTTFYNVIDYGADPSGVNDSTSAIQNCVNAVVNVFGGIIRIPVGVYNISNTINVFANGISGTYISFLGDSYPSVFNWVGNANSSVIHSRGWHSSTIDNLTIRTNNVANTVAWDIDTDSTYPSTEALTFRNCTVEIGSGGNCTGWRGSLGTTGAGDVSFMTFITCIVIGANNALGDIGWNPIRANCLNWTWYDCIGYTLGKVFTNIRTGGGESGGGSMMFYGLGTSGCNTDFEFATAGQYAIYGGRFENGKRFLTCGSGGATWAAPVVVDGVSISAYTPPDGILFLTSCAVNLTIKSSFIYNGAGYYDSNMITIYNTDPRTFSVAVYDSTIQATDPFYNVVGSVGNVNVTVENSFQIANDITSGIRFTESYVPSANINAAFATINSTFATLNATAAPGGSNTQIQFNKNGTFGGSANLLFNLASNILTIGSQTVITQPSGGNALYVQGALNSAAVAIDSSGAGFSALNFRENNVSTYAIRSGYPTANVLSIYSVNTSAAQWTLANTGAQNIAAPITATTALTVTGNTGAGQAILSQGKIQISGNSALNQGEIGIQNLAPGGGNWRIGDGIGTSNGVFTFYDSLGAAIRWKVDANGSFTVQDPGSGFKPLTVSGSGILQTTANASTSPELRLQRTVGTTTDWEIYCPSGSTDLRFFSSSDRYVFGASGGLSINGTAATATAALVLGGTTTAAIWYTATNTGGGLVFGLESSTGGYLLGGSSAYAASLYSTTELNLGAGSGTAIKISSARNVTINAPTSGVALAITSTASGGYAMTITGAGTNATYYHITNTGGALISGIENSAGGGNVLIGSTAYAGCMGTENATNFYLGSNNIARVGIGSTGAITINAPTSGVALTVNGVSTSSLMTVNGGGISTSYINWQTAGVTKGYIGTDGGSIIAGGTGTSLCIRSEADVILVSGAGTYVTRYNSTGNWSIPAAGSGTAVTIYNATNMPLSLQTSSNGPWGLELYRTDTSFSSKVYNNGAQWYFEHRPSFAGQVPLDASNYATYVVTLSSTQISSLGVGTAASGTTGEIRATNNITAFFSDMRLKVRGKNIENALSKVLSLNGFYFKPNQTAKDLGYDDTKEYVGVSAQEVEKILPEVVVPAPIDDKYLSVQYDKLIPLLIEAIKEQQSQIDKLNNMVEKLTNT